MKKGYIPKDMRQRIKFKYAINEKGEEIIECEFQEVKDLNKGKFCGKYENKWGLYDLDGSCYIENNFSELKYIGSFLDNYAAMTNGKWEIIDCWGNIKSTNNYISINNFYSDFSLSPSAACLFFNSLYKLR